MQSKTILCLPPELGPGQLVDMLSAAESQLQEAKASKWPSAGKS